MDRCGWITKTKSRPLTKAISTRNSAATHYASSMTLNAFANQGACLTPTLDALTS